jgi:hypothetical protein
MGSWTTYKGLEVPDSATGDGGINLTDDLKALADRAPYQSASDPTVSDDSGDGFIPGSQWLNTSTLTMWVCTDNSSGAAQWRSLYRRIDNAIVLAPEAGIGGTDNRAIQLDTGGNARGQNAVDMQSVRNSDSQVASGFYSFVAGGRFNTANGIDSHAEGSTTTASGCAAHAEGWNTSANSWGAHAEGLGTTANGYGSHAEGGGTYAGIYSHAEGRSTSAGGTYSHAEGSRTYASGFASHAEGSCGTVASGFVSHAEGGNTIAFGNYSHAGGFGSKPHLNSQWARASGGHSYQIGTAQTTLTHLFRLTTNNTSTEVTLGGGSPSSDTRFSVLDGQTLSCFINIVGRKENGGTNDHGSFMRQVLIRREGSTTALVGSVQTIGTDINPAGWGGVTITADDTNETLKIEVTGASSTNIRWMATVMASEVADAAI